MTITAPLWTRTPVPAGRSFVAWPGTQALIHGGEPSRSLGPLPAAPRVSVSSGPPKHVQPFPPDAASRRRASVAFAPAASKRIAWCTSVRRCGFTTAEVTYMSCASFGSRSMQW